MKQYIIRYTKKNGQSVETYLSDLSKAKELAKKLSKTLERKVYVYSFTSDNILTYTKRLYTFKAN